MPREGLRAPRQAANPVQHEAQPACMTTEIIAEAEALPRLTELSYAIACDKERNLIFLYKEDAGAALARVFELDVADPENVRCKELTHNLYYRNAKSSHCAQDEQRHLPALYQPCLGSVYLNGRHFLIVWGGARLTATGGIEELSSNLITIDTEAKRWSIEEVRGAPGVARFWACMAVVDRKLFIFDGFDQQDVDLKTDCQHRRLASYSCIEFIETADAKYWQWVDVDVPYPHNVGPSRFEYATPIANGSKILLTPCIKSPLNGGGRFSTVTPADFLWTFDVGQRTFTVLDSIQGRLPKNLSCYHPWCFNSLVPQPDALNPPDILLICSWETTNAGAFIRLPKLYKLVSNDWNDAEMEQLKVDVPLKAALGQATYMSNFIVINERVILLGTSDPQKAFDDMELDVALFIPLNWIGL